MRFHLTKSAANRNLLGYLLLSGEEWNDSHLATRCCFGDVSNGLVKGLKSTYEILGAGSVACYALSTRNPKFSFPTCSYQCLNPEAIEQLQKYCIRPPASDFELSIARHHFGLASLIKIIFCVLNLSCQILAEVLKKVKTKKKISFSFECSIAIANFSYENIDKFFFWI